MNRIGYEVERQTGMLGAVLHTGLGIFLKEVADIDREAFEFLVESLTGAET